MSAIVVALLSVCNAGDTIIAADAASHDGWYHNGYFGGQGWDDHVSACEDAYRTYDYRSDTYVRKINGHLARVYCEL